VSGLGTVYATTIVHRPPAGLFAHLVPYTFALVDLDEGVRVVTMITGCPPEHVRVGTRFVADVNQPGTKNDGTPPLIFSTPNR
jgi:uncharacterized OB-fold protein